MSFFILVKRSTEQEIEKQTLVSSLYSDGKLIEGTSKSYTVANVSPVFDNHNKSIVSWN